VNFIPRLFCFAFVVSILELCALNIPACAGPEAANAEEVYYRMITLPTPVAVTSVNSAPETVQMEAGSLCFLGPDKLACSSRIGDIWLARHVLGDDPKPTWFLFASGLHEILGLAVKPNDKDGWVYCTQRGEVTRMRDSSGDGRADVFETVSDAWGVNGDYHEYAFGSKFDRHGNLWVALCLTGSNESRSPFRGWAMQITPDGKTVPVGSGIRSPGGIGFNAEGDVFYTDNQGTWNGACKLQQIVPGGFFGHPAGNRWFDDPATKDIIAEAGVKKPLEPESGSRVATEAKRIPELVPPSVYFPYPTAGDPKMGHSTSGIAPDTTRGKFGPFAGQLFVGEHTDSTVMRVFLEKVGGHWQGACFPFRKGFASGVLSLEFARDGSLFTYGTDRGWGARGGNAFALQSLRWTGKVPFEIREMRARADGFELTFTEPVDEKTVAEPASYKLETYTYIYQATYGSPEVDATTPDIKTITVAPDKMSARLVVDGLQPGHVHELHAAGVRSAKGAPLLHDAAYYTLFFLPAK